MGRRMTGAPCVIPPVRRGLQRCCNVCQPVFLVHIASCRQELRDLSLVRALPPNGDPELNMADVLDQMRMLFKPFRALVQTILGSFDFDCKMLEWKYPYIGVLSRSRTMSIDPALYQRPPDW